MLGKTRAVTGAIPGMLGAVVFESAAEMWATRHGWCKKSYCGFKGIDSELWVQNGARRIKNGCVCVVFPLNEVTEDVGCDH